MSRLAIVVCAVLFASAANASLWNNTLQTVRDNVQEVIDTAISKVEEEFVFTQLKTIRVAAELSNITTKFGEKIWEQVSSITENVTLQIRDITCDVKGVCINECMKMADRLGDIGKAGVAATSGCLNSKLNNGLGHIDSINQISNNMLNDLNELSEKAQHCGENIVCANTAADAIHCSKSAAANATWISIKAAPRLTVGWTKLKFLMITLRHSLASCKNNKKLATFYQESSTVVEKIQTCIKRKVEEYRINGPEKNHMIHMTHMHEDPNVHQWHYDDDLSLRESSEEDNFSFETDFSTPYKTK